MTQVYSAGDDKVVRVWDVATEKCLNILTGHDVSTKVIFLGLHFCIE